MGTVVYERAQAAETVEAAPSSSAIAAKVAVSIGGAVLATICAVYVTSFWTDVPYYDEWFMVPWIDRVAHGEWSPLDFFQSGQGHTGLPYRVVTFLSVKLLHYDARLPIIVAFVLMTGAAILLGARYSRQARSAPILYAVSLIAVWAALFTLHNWENLLATWAINAAAVTFFMVAALCLVERKSVVAFYTGIACAVVCTLSFTNGVLIWPALGLMVFLDGRRDRLIPVAIGAGLMFLMIWLGHDKLGSSMNLLNAPGRFFAVLGAPFPFTHQGVSMDGALPEHAITLAIALGVVACLAPVGLVALRTNLFRDREALKSLRFPLAILLVGFGSCAMVALGRSDLGIGQAMSSRYVITTMLVYIGIVLLCLECAELPVARLTGAGISVILILAFAHAASEEFKTGPYRGVFYANWRQTVLNYQTATDEQLANPHLTPDEIRKHSATLDALDLGPFARPAH